MALHLEEISLAVAPGAHAILLLDQAGWHVSKRLSIPDNITLSREKNVARRRESGDHSEVLSEETRGKRPRYYLQNFHFQSGGWMTDESAQRFGRREDLRRR